LGEAAIITLPNGQPYYLAVMVERPHNSEAAAQYIREVATLTYRYFTTAAVVEAVANGSASRGVTPSATAVNEASPHSVSSLSTPPTPTDVEVF
jgi:hypothetical protein